MRKINIEEWVKYCKRAGATVLILDIKNYCVLFLDVRSVASLHVSAGALKSKFDQVGIGGSLAEDLWLVIVVRIGRLATGKAVDETCHITQNPCRIPNITVGGRHQDRSKRAGSVVECNYHRG